MSRRRVGSASDGRVTKETRREDWLRNERSSDERRTYLNVKTKKRTRNPMHPFEIDRSIDLPIPECNESFRERFQSAMKSISVSESEATIWVSSIRLSLDLSSRLSSSIPNVRSHVESYLQRKTENVVWREKVRGMSRCVCLDIYVCVCAERERWANEKKRKNPFVYLCDDWWLSFSFAFVLARIVWSSSEWHRRVEIVCIERKRLAQLTFMTHHHPVLWCFVKLLIELRHALHRWKFSHFDEITPIAVATLTFSDATDPRSRDELINNRNLSFFIDTSFHRS